LSHGIFILGVAYIILTLERAHANFIGMAVDTKLLWTERARQRECLQSRVAVWSFGI